MTPLISVTNQTSVLTDDEVRPFVAALQIQVTRDFYPAWGINAVIQFLPTKEPLPDEAWQLALLDNSDQSGFLGYHLKSPKGTPLGKVFVKTDQSHGLNWTVTGSHEALEMLGDPGANLVLMLEGDAHAREVCDACEDEQFQYWIDVPGHGKVAMSDFTYPRYWLPGAAPGQYDHCGVLKSGLRFGEEEWRLATGIRPRVAARSRPARA